MDSGEDHMDEADFKSYKQYVHNDLWWISGMADIMAAFPEIHSSITVQFLALGEA